jgi:topoisomerase-4 subunit B
LLNFYMGKNTTERQNFIINNLVVEEDVEWLTICGLQFTI